MCGLSNSKDRCTCLKCFQTRHTKSIMTILLTSSLQYCLLSAVVLIYDHLRISKRLSMGWIYLWNCVLRHSDKFIYVVTDDALTHEWQTEATIGCCYSSHHLKRRPFLLPQTPLFFVRLNLQTGPLLQAGDGDGGGGRWQLWQGPPKGQKRFLKSGRQEFHNPSLSDWGICLLNIQLFLLAKCPLKSSCNCVGKKETKQDKWEGWV